MIAIIAAALAAAAAPPAGALAKDFQRLCMRHRGDLAAPIAEAEAEGWKPVPEAAMQKLALQVTRGEARFHAGAGPDGPEFLATGHADLPGGDAIHANVCVLFARTASFKAAVSQATALVGAPPTHVEAAMAGYIFTEAGGRRRSLEANSDVDAKAAFAQPGATLLMVQALQGGASMSYFIPSN